MRRWSGIDVWMPSTTKKSSALTCAIAFLPAPSWNDELATSES